MNHAPSFYKVRMLAYESLLLLKTEWRLHFGAAVGIVVLSLVWALCSQNPTIFTRSGALMTIAGAIMMYRAHFRGIEDAFLRDTGRSDRRAFRRWRPLRSKAEAKAEDAKAFRYGFLSIVLGTLIWAYGDLVLLLEVGRAIASKHLTFNLR
jgi:hypothetical protein